MDEQPIARQEEAVQYVGSIEDPKVRLLCEAFLSRAVGRIGTARIRTSGRIDLYVVMQMAADFFADTRTIDGIMSGGFESLDDIDHAF